MKLYEMLYIVHFQDIKFDLYGCRTTSVSRVYKKRQTYNSLAIKCSINTKK